jgi:hypothetical protein
MSDKIYIGIDDKRIEAKGEVLEQILKDRADAELEASRIEAAELERQKAKRIRNAQVKKSWLN